MLQKRPIPLDDVLSFSWKDYLHALHVQLSAWQVKDSTWQRWPISLDETRDRSWVDALSRFREHCSGIPLAKIGEEGRAILIGTYKRDPEDAEETKNTYFFGGLKGAGLATSVVQYPEDWPQQVKVIDDARALARSLPKDPGAELAVAPWRTIGMLARFGTAAASRLLLAERPDLYVMLNSASLSGLEQITKVSIPKTHQMPGVSVHYQEVLSAIYDAPWWKEPRPRPAREAFLWDCRAALLDVFTYTGEQGV